MKQIRLTMDYVEAHGLEIKWQGRSDNEAAHYCNNCDVSLWSSPDFLLFKLNIFPYYSFSFCLFTQGFLRKEYKEYPSGSEV